MVENSFGILVKRFRVVLITIEQKPKIVRDIVLTCVVLHSMLRRHQGAADRPPTLADDIQTTTGGPGGTGTESYLQKSIHGGQTSTRPTEKLLQSHGGACWAGGQSLRRMRGETCCHISVLFRTTQIIQELLFSKVLPPLK